MFCDLTMATVIRIKRNLNDDPLDAVILNCKKRKIDDGSAQDVGDLSAIFKFAGTSDNPEEDVLKHIKKSVKVNTEDKHKTHTSDIIAKLRKQNQESSKNSRFKVVNSFRSQDAEQTAAESDLSWTIVDVEAEENKENVDVTKTVDDSDARFVYDLYYTNSDDFGESDLYEWISLDPLSDTPFDDAHQKNCDDAESEYSEDSNAENNWRNDYPDEYDSDSPEERDSSINETDMLQAMNRVTLHDDDLSSDDYDNAFGYDREEDNGSSYAKFKAKMTKDLEDNFCYYDDSCTP